jgi:hypothetical protein
MRRGVGRYSLIGETVGVTGLEVVSPEIRNIAISSPCVTRTPANDSKLVEMLNCTRNARPALAGVSAEHVVRRPCSAFLGVIVAGQFDAASNIGLGQSLVRGNAF